MLALGKHKREAETPGKNNNPHHLFTTIIIHYSFSMDSSPALLPVQLPGHFTEEQLVVTDKLVDTASHSDPIPSNQITIPRPLHDLETNAFWDGPLSPHTVQNVLAGHENLAPTQLQALVAGLTTTL